MRVFQKLAAVASASLILGLVAVPAQAEIGPSAAPDPETVTAAPLPTWQTNGTVWDMAVVNGVVYVGGNFTSVRPPGAAPGTGEVTRNRLAAFNAATGDLLSWAPSANSTPFTPQGTPDRNCTLLSSGQVECATVWSIVPTPDNKSIIVGGDFQTIDGKVRAGLAAFSVGTGVLSTSTPGTLNTTFKPSVSGRVYSVATTGSTVYIGGSVTKVGTGSSAMTVTGLASFNFPGDATQAPIPTFNPTVVPGNISGFVNGVRKIVITADGTRLIVGGGFNSVAGRAIHGLQAVDAVTGAPATWNSNRITNSAQVTNLKIYDNVLYTNADANGSTSEGIIAIDAATGSDLWFDGCRGASHSMALVRGVVYVGSHSHDCGAMQGGFPEQYNGYPTTDNRRYTLRAETPTADGGMKLLPWSPKTDDMNGARDMEFDGTNLWVGGEFTSVDYGSQQGLTRFGFLGATGSDRKPLKPNAPIATSSKPGVIDISFQQVEDPDNRTLTYELIKDGNTADPIYTATAAAPPWSLGWLQFQDIVADGSTHTYDVRATDPLGAKSSRSEQTTITAASASAPLSELAKADGAAMQFSFETRVNSTFVDGIGGKIAAAQNGATLTTGNGNSGNAVALSGSSSSLSRGVAVVQTREWTTRQFSVETMFKTSTTRGGSLVSFGSSNSGSSTSGSPTGQLYMDNLGRLNFGLQPNADRTGNPWGSPTLQRRAVTTPGSYSDNQWHHVVATFQPGTGARIFVDGSLVAENPTMVWTLPVNAYFRMGADSLSGFPNTPSSTWWAGTLDEVATYKYPLSAKQVLAHSNAVFRKLSAPDGLAGSAASTTAIDLTWKAVDNASGYNVYRDGVLVGSPTTTSFNDTGLTASTTYAYTVAATNGAGEGPKTDSVNVRTSDPLPAPAGLAASQVTQTSLKVSWGAVSSATGYNVYRDGVLVGSPTTTSFNDSGLTAGTTYKYTVSATNAGGEGPASAELSVKTSAPSPVSLFTSGNVWKYDLTGVPADGWSSASFDDSAWAAGPSKLGFGGRNDQATVISKFMPDGVTNRVTTYFRTSFTLPANPAATSLTLRYKLDDGLILYLNGQEVLRDNLKSGSVGPNDQALMASPDDGNTWRTVTLPVSALVDGTNSLAAEVHNFNTMSDLQWDAELTANFN